MFKIILFCLLLFNANECFSNKKISNDLMVSVYYEALCPDSIKFIVYQLFPNFLIFEKYVKWELIPFGNAKASKENGKWTFQCQHGPKECYANKIHSCAIALDNVEKSTKFVYCSMNSNDPSSNEILSQVSVKVSIYYEALCFDSIKFITKQLYPNYSEIADHIELDFVPYGKAIHNKVNGSYEFSCQHGPSECRGNKYHSCILSQKNGQYKDVEFIGCIMSRRNPSYFANVETCARRIDLDITSLKNCTHGREGDELLAQYGDRTLNLEPSISFVPTIIYNDVYDKDDQWRSLQDFVAVVCHKLNGTKPQICVNKSLPTTSGWW